MCGITGWFGIDVPADARAARLAAMSATLQHRGPDDRGRYIDDHVALAIQRLSIVDVAGGQQPMASDDGAIQLVFNGEIYNHAALRRALERDGVGFRTRSDTEVILRLYERAGLAALTQLNGMFAIALWDRARATLTLVRDRLGVKPLYYAGVGGGLVFGSEIKAILASGVVARTLDEHGLWDYLTFRYVPAPHSIWRGVAKLPPGQWLQIRADGRGPQLRAWWQMPMAAPHHPAPDREYEDQFAALFQDAVDLRMLADVPVGVTLSGGLDSSAVAAAASAGGAQLKTYTVAFADSPATDERPYARAVANQLGCDHHEIEIGQREFMEFLPEFVWYTDEPLADLAAIPLYYVCRLAAQQVKVLLSGEGSDEILAGYTFDERVREWDTTAATAAARWPARARSALGPLVRALPAAWRATTAEAAAQPLSMTDYWSSADKRALLKRPADWPDSLDRVRAHYAQMADQPPLNQALYSYCHDWLVEDLLMKADRMSMATSVELRTPFLDYRLVEWAARLPLHLKVGRTAAGYRSKEILRRYARARLPASVIERPKQGFPVPVYGWLANSLREWAHGLLLANDSQLANYLERAPLTAVVAAGTAAAATTLERHRLWNLLVLELWCRRWLGAA